MVINTRLKSKVAFVRQLSMKLSRAHSQQATRQSSLPNPDEHDAEGSGIDPAQGSRPRPSRADIVMTEDPGKKSKKASAPASSRSTKKRTTAPAQVTHGEVARRAYYLFLARGCEHGHDLDDWLQAEREVRGTPSATTRRARTSTPKYLERMTNHFGALRGKRRTDS